LESNSAIPGEPPRRFVAWGRLYAGLAISVAGAIILHSFHTHEPVAFGVVASVAGLVLNIWGFLGTVLHPKATTEDVFWAYTFLNLLLIALTCNLRYNGWDYGFYLENRHMIRLVISLLAADVGAFVAVREPTSLEYRALVGLRMRELINFLIVLIFSSVMFLSI